MTLTGRSRISFGILAMFSALYAGILMTIYWPNTGVIYAFLIFFATFSVCVAYFYVRDGGFFQPMFFVITSLLLGTVLKIIYISLGANNPFVDRVLLLGKDLTILEGGVLLITVAMISISLGYMILGKSSPSPNRTIEITLQNRMTNIICLLLLAISIAALFVYFIENEFSMLDISGKRFLTEEGANPSERFGDTGYYLFKLALLAKTTLYIYLIQCLTRGSSTKFRKYLLLLVAFLWVAFVSLYFSNRIVTITVMADILIITFLFVSKVKKKWLFLSAIAALAVFMLASSLRSEAGATKTFTDHIFAGRYLLDISKASHFYEFFNSNNTLLGYFTSEEFENPLFLYVNLGRAAGTTVFGMRAAGVPLGYVIEMLSLAGLLGVSLGMFLLGLFLRYLTKIPSKRHNKDYVLLIYALVTTRSTIFLFNGGIGSTFYQLIVDLTPILVVVLLSSLQSRHMRIRMPAASLR